MNKYVYIGGSVAFGLLVSLELGVSYFVGTEFIKEHKKSLAQASKNGDVDIKVDVSGNALFGYEIDYKIVPKAADGAMKVQLKENQFTAKAYTSHGLSYTFDRPLSLLRYDANFAADFMQLDTNKEIPLRMNISFHGSPISSSGGNLELLPFKIEKDENLVELDKSLKFDFELEDTLAAIKGNDTVLKFSSRLESFKAKTKELDSNIEGAHFDFQLRTKQLIDIALNPTKFAGADQESKSIVAAYSSFKMLSYGIKKWEISSEMGKSSGENLLFEVGNEVKNTEWTFYSKLNGDKLSFKPKGGGLPFEIEVNKLGFDFALSGLSEKSLDIIQKSVDMSEKEAFAALQASNNLSVNLNEMVVDLEGFGKFASALSLKNEKYPKGFEQNPMALLSTVDLELNLEAPLGNPMVSMMLLSQPQAKLIVDMLVSEEIIKKDKSQYSTKISLSQGKLKAFDKDLSDDPRVAPFLNPPMAH